MYHSSIEEIINSLPNDYEKCFQESEKLAIQNLAQNDHVFLPPNLSEDKRDRATLDKHIEHCVHQMIRIPYQALVIHEFPPHKIMQFGLNLGRAQELLLSYGGVDCWFRMFKPYFRQNITPEELKKIISLGFQLCNVLKIEYPTQEYLDRP
jgi:hypothetical protein